MLAAGGLYYRDNTSIEGNLSMTLPNETILNEFGLRRSREPLLSAQTFALEHLVSIHCATTDLRWAMAELGLRSITATWASAQGRFVRWARGGKPSHAHRVTAADTTVAAGRR